MSNFYRGAPPPGGPEIPYSPSSPHDGQPEESCSLLGPFAILIQAALGGLALLSLVYKRWRERPQRPLKIWGFDVSKQVVGSILLHLVNLLMSELSSGSLGVIAQAAKGAQGAAEAIAASANAAVDKEGGTGGAVGGNPTGEQREGMGMLVLRGIYITSSSLLAPRQGDDAGGPDVGPAHMPHGANNPCSFYLLNLAIDTTIGIPILITLLKLVTVAARKTPLANPPESIKSGNYGQPTKVRTTWWLKQCLIYFIGLLGMKLCVFAIFQLCPWLGAVGDWALRWTEGNEDLQIFFVMLLFPLIMNALQYYIIDGFIKEQKGGSGERYEEVPQEEDAVVGGEGVAEAGRVSVDGDHGAGKNPNTTGVNDEMPDGGHGRSRTDSDKTDEYNANLDGHHSSSSRERSGEDGALLGPDGSKTRSGGGMES